MTQHCIDGLTTAKGEKVNVLTGWDRPLQGFFLVIEAANDDRVIYCNLDDPKLSGCGGLPSSFDYFQQVTTGLGVVVPAQVWKNLQGDQIANRGNAYTIYSPDGSVVRQLPASA